MPYEERKSFMESQCDQFAQRMSHINFANVNKNGLDLNKQEDSSEFEKASDGDSEFEDDYIDASEEFAGASRSVKLSIRALHFNNMIAYQNGSKRVSLLSRASNLVSSGRPSAENTMGNFDCNSKFLN